MKRCRAAFDAAKRILANIMPLHPWISHLIEGRREWWTEMETDGREVIQGAVGMLDVGMEAEMGDGTA